MSTIAIRPTRKIGTCHSAGVDGFEPAGGCTVSLAMTGIHSSIPTPEIRRRGHGAGVVAFSARDVKANYPSPLGTRRVPSCVGDLSREQAGVERMRQQLRQPV